MGDTTRVQTDRGFVPLNTLTSLSSTRFLDITASAMTVDASWQGLCVRFQAACLVTIPLGLPDDFDCAWSQESAGQITFQAANGLTLQSVDGAKKSAGQYALGGIGVWGSTTARLYGSLTA